MDDLGRIGTRYVAKLRRTGRPAALIAAVMDLIATLRRHAGDAWTLAQAAHTPTLLLARAVGLDVAKRMRLAPGGVADTAGRLLARIVSYATAALAELANRRDALAERLSLIVVAETQRAIADASQAAAVSATTIVRAASSDACDACANLAGTYTAPFPADLWWTHPNCACTWTTPKGAPVWPT